MSVVSGLPKDFTASRFRRGQFGDDAWFIARNLSADVIGVADGVGGWRNYGITIYNLYITMYIYMYI